MEILSAAEMQAADKMAIEELGIPGLVLMENAGRLVAETILDEWAECPPERVVVLAGRGNNGGDGFVIARHLARAGIVPELFLVGATLDKLRGDAAAMARAWQGTGGTVEEIPNLAAWDAAAPILGREDLVVDALFGTGLSRPLEGLAAQVVEDVGSSAAGIVAVDIPSGLFASSAEIPGPHLPADLTVTFARPKIAHMLPPAEDVVGELLVVDIGIPPEAIRAAQPRLHWTTEADAALLLPLRENEDHKGRFGHVLVVAGARGKAGAAALAGWGALRGGAGLVTVASPACVRAEVAGFAPELMTEPLPATKDGQLARDAHRAALALPGDHDVLAIGPGLGQERGTQTEIRRLVLGTKAPVVLDADGLNAFAGRHAASLSRCRGPLVLTPHPGEAARLLGIEIAELQADRVDAAERLAELADAVVVLKGYRSVVAAPGGPIAINPTGNPGMASGGMGDLLTGLVASFLAQGLDAFEAALLGTYVHGAAADVALEGGESESSLTAGGVAAALPEVFRYLEQENESA